ncbi:MAG: dicarboxylate/amino acid:cation symporter, partial [Proteobacteria bacterium]|nr:dicarboxylate/amino acid:cation symporter [Pseudomonadota bacterium]
MGITAKIFAGLIAGAVLGLLLNLTALNNIPMIREFFTDGLFFVVGQIFIRLLQMLVVPVVFLSLVCGTAGLGDLRQLGRVGGKSLFLYTLTTVVAVALGCLFAGIIEPGVGFNITRAEKFVSTEAPSLRDTLIALVPRNPIESFARGEMLPIIVFAIFFGVAATLSGKAGESTLKAFNALNDVMMKLVDLVISLSPIGVFCLVAKVFSEQGLEAMLPLGKYFFTVLLVLLLQVGFVYTLLLKVIGRLSPFRFFKKFYEVMLFAFSTASSNATIPVTLEVVEKRLGVKNSVASFTIPLGATVNMDGTAIMQGV